MAARFGVTVETIGSDVKAIYDDWLHTAPAKARVLRARRVKQLEGILQKAINSFEKSLKDNEEEQWMVRPCSKCAGAEPDLDEPPCKECRGKGEVRSRSGKIKGTSGDPAFLKVAEDCVKEAARLEGLYRPKQVDHRHSGKVEHRHAHLHVAAGANGTLAGASGDDLLKAREMIRRLKKGLPLLEAVPPAEVVVDEQKP